MQLSTESLKLIASITHTDTFVSAAVASSQHQRRGNVLSVNTKESSFDDILMSHRYNLRSRHSLPSDTTLSDKSESSNSSSRPTRRRSLPTPSSNSPYLVGFAPYFIPSYRIMEQQDQVNAVSASQDNLNAIGVEEQDAQNLLAANENLDRSPEQAISVVDSTYKRNQINSFLARIKDDIHGLKDALLDQIATSIIDEEFQDIIEMVKNL